MPTKGKSSSNSQPATTCVPSVRANTFPLTKAALWPNMGRIFTPRPAGTTFSKNSVVASSRFGNRKDVAPSSARYSD